MNLDKVKVMWIVKIGLVFGMLQALATIPFGGGYAYLIYPAAFFGVLGLVLALLLNSFSTGARIGVIIGIVIYLLAFGLAHWQISMDLKVTGEDDDDDFETRKENTIEDMKTDIREITLFIVLLAASTGMVTLGLTVPHFFGDTERKMLMLIPLLFTLLAVTFATILSMEAMDEWMAIMDELEAAENMDELNAVGNKINALDAMDLVKGSRIGGVFNLLGLISVFIISFLTPLELDSAPMGGYDYSQGPSRPPPSSYVSPFGSPPGAPPSPPFQTPGAPTGYPPGPPGYPGQPPAGAPPAPPTGPPAGPGAPPVPGAPPTAPPEPAQPTPPGAATPTATVECPGCQAHMQVPRLGRQQVVKCVKCGLAGEIEI